MAKPGKTDAQADNELPTETTQPKSLVVARKGLKTSKDFANFMAALMTDIVEGKVSPGMGNASCNAGGKLLKVVEMEYKYGTKDDKGNPNKTLTLAFEQPTE